MWIESMGEWDDPYGNQVQTQPFGLVMLAILLTALQKRISQK